MSWGLRLLCLGRRRPPACWLAMEIASGPTPGGATTPGCRTWDTDASLDIPSLSMRKTQQSAMRGAPSAETPVYRFSGRLQRLTPTAGSENNPAGVLGPWERPWAHDTEVSMIWLLASMKMTDSAVIPMRLPPQVMARR